MSFTKQQVVAFVVATLILFLERASLLTLPTLEANDGVNDIETSSLTSSNIQLGDLIESMLELLSSRRNISSKDANLLINLQLAARLFSLVDAETTRQAAVYVTHFIKQMHALDDDNHVDIIACLRRAIVDLHKLLASSNSLHSANVHALYATADVEQRLKKALADDAASKSHIELAEAARVQHEERVSFDLAHLAAASTANASRHTTFADVVLCVHGREFHLHKRILSLRSAYFRQVLNENR